MSPIENRGKKLLESAIKNDSENKATLFYIDTKKAAASGLGDDILNIVRGLDSGLIHKITDPASSVKIDVKEQTDSIQFRRWFGNSKVVNADGTPKVMYHGTKEQFTQFSKDKAKASGAWRKGFYFTDEKTHAGQYGEQMKVYLRAENPLRNNDRNITRRQMANFIKAVANNDDYGIDNYGYGATVQSVLNSVYSGKSDLKMLNDINSTCIGDFAEAIALFNKVNGTR